MRIRTALAAAFVIVAGGAGVASASTTAPPPVVTITHNDGGTQVGTGISGQPLVGAAVDNRGVCVSFSYQNGSCVPLN